VHYRLDAARFVEVVGFVERARAAAQPLTRRHEFPELRIGSRERTSSSVA
jgi:hypothetical protein